MPENETELFSSVLPLRSSITPLLCFLVAHVSTQLAETLLGKSEARKKDLRSAKCPMYKPLENAGTFMRYSCVAFYALVSRALTSVSHSSECINKLSIHRRQRDYVEQFFQLNFSEKFVCTLVLVPC